MSTQLEQQLKHEKKRQIQELKDLWKGERERMENMTNADLDQKIINLYKKH